MDYPKCIFFQTKTIMTTVSEVKKRFKKAFCLFPLLPKSMCKLIRDLCINFEPCFKHQTWSNDYSQHDLFWGGVSLSTG